MPIGNYIADFACLSARFIVEVDGAQHSEPPNEETDKQRTEWLETRGYRVLRFWNSQVLAEIDCVTETIFNALDAVPVRVTRHPDPPPSGEGE